MDRGQGFLYAVAVVLASVVLLSLGLILFVAVAAVGLVLGCAAAVRLAWVRRRARRRAFRPQPRVIDVVPERD